jgi:hypothetical protein
MVLRQQEIKSERPKAIDSRWLISNRVHLAYHEDWLGSIGTPVPRTTAMMVAYQLEIKMGMIAMVVVRKFSSGIDGSRISLSIGAAVNNLFCTEPFRKHCISNLGSRDQVPGRCLMDVYGCTCTTCPAVDCMKAIGSQNIGQVLGRAVR